MKNFALVLFFLILPTCRGDYPMDALKSFSPCTLNCMVGAITQSSCSLTDLDCQCRSEATSGIEGNATNCMLKDCSIKESLVAKNITYTVCDYPVRDRSSEYNTLTIVAGIVANIFVVQRLIFKKYRGLSYGADDWFIAATMVIGICGCFLNTRGLGYHGLGRDIWTMTPDQIILFAKLFYVMQIYYFTMLATLKLSLLFFFARVFPKTAAPLTAKLITWTIVFTVINWLLFASLAAFSCQPVSFFWHKWERESQGTCLNLNALGWSHAVISILQDIWMLVIPLMTIGKLQLDLQKRIGVTLMFLTGLAVTCISVIRLRTLIVFTADSLNPSWEDYEISKWSTIEITVGALCACVPSIRLVLAEIRSRVSTITGSRGTALEDRTWVSLENKGQGPSQSGIRLDSREVAV